MQVPPFWTGVDRPYAPGPRAAPRRRRPRVASPSSEEVEDVVGDREVLAQLHSRAHDMHPALQSAERRAILRVERDDLPVDDDVVVDDGSAISPVSSGNAAVMSLPLRLNSRALPRWASVTARWPSPLHLERPPLTGRRLPECGQHRRRGSLRETRRCRRACVAWRTAGHPLLHSGQRNPSCSRGGERVTGADY